MKEIPILPSVILKRERGAEHKGVFFRERALTILEKSTVVSFNGIARNAYSGHTSTIEGSVDDVRTQFVDTLRNCDYALCVKGDANSSVRFYEALSLGKIPLFVDTACVLPLEDTIPYREFCVFVDWKDLDKIDTIVADFHAQCSPERFIRMQEQAREMYIRYLRTDAFSPQLSSILRKKLQKL